MHQFRLIFLLFVALICSGYRFRCYIFCNEQTAVQNDYVEQRDDCRYYAQKNIDSKMANTQNQNSGKARKIKLVELFSDCMNRYGWDVPSGSNNKRNKFANNEVPLYVASVSNIAARSTNQNSAANSQAGSTANSSRVVSKKYRVKQQQKVYSHDVFAKNQYKQKNSKQLNKIAPAAGSQKKSVVTTIKKRHQEPSRDVFAKSPYKQKTTKKIKSTTALQKETVVTTTKQKRSTHQITSKNIDKQKTTNKTPNLVQNQNTNPSKIQSQPKVTAKNGGNKTPKQLSKIAPAAGVAATPKTKVKTKANRAFECKGARRFATISKRSANMAKLCQEECDRLLKKFPEGRRPAACPKQKSTNKTPPKQLNELTPTTKPQREPIINTIKQKVTTSKTSSNNNSKQGKIKTAPDALQTKNISNTTNKKNTYISEIQSQPKTTAKQIKQENTKQLSRLAPAAGVTTTPKTKAKTEASRAFECKVARRFATTSIKAANMAKTCKTECAKQSKNTPKDKIPAACPNQKLTNKSLGTSPNTVPEKQKNLDNQLYSKNNNKHKETPKQLNKLAPAAGVATSTKAKETARSKRSFECEIARNSATTSNSAAKLAKDCRKECNKLLKNTINKRRPAACPKNKKTNGSVMNLLDTQLKDKK